MRRRLAPTEPSPEAVAMTWRNARILVPLTRFLLRPWIKLEPVGLEHLPKEGSFLVIANHVGFMDPVAIICAARRPISWMATPSLLDEGFLARIMQWFGVIPKKKFIADTSAIRRFKAWVKAGGIVGLFPEAVRCWDGKTAPLMPGTERLVKMAGVPVVTVRFRNAYQQWPRWAEQVRSGVIRVEFDPPRTFERSTPDAEIMEYLTERIAVRHYDPPQLGVRGRKLARGITNVLWGCRSCDAFGQMREDNDHVWCDACGDRWRVDTSTDLIEVETGDRVRIDTFMEDNLAALQARDMVPDPARFERDGVLLESEPMTLVERTDSDPLEVAEGHLRLERETLSVCGPDGERRWSVALDELRVVTVDMRRRLQFRTSEQLFEAMMPTQSVVAWEIVAGHWAPRVRAQAEQRKKTRT